MLGTCSCVCKAECVCLCECVCMCVCSTTPVVAPLLFLYAHIAGSSANFPVDVGIFSVCHLNCLITWIDCEKRATAATTTSTFPSAFLRGVAVAAAAGAGVALSVHRFGSSSAIRKIKKEAGKREKEKESQVNAQSIYLSQRVRQHVEQRN